MEKTPPIGEVFFIALFYLRRAERERERLEEVDGCLVMVSVLSMVYLQMYFSFI
jgi:hypothetical protein